VYYDVAPDRSREKLSVFHFPTDVALRDKWYKSKPRNPEEYKNNNRPPVVCEKHFATDRGGLRWPTDFLLEVVTQVFIVFQALISKDFENKFLTVRDPFCASYQLKG
jgi:hypothetical protein